MKLNVDFSRLHAVIERMGAKRVEIIIDGGREGLEPIDIELGEGKEIELKDVEYGTGLLSYKGRQILLYIQDHGGSVGKALKDGAVGKKYHVADCRTLQSMRAKSMSFDGNNPSLSVDHGRRPMNWLILESMDCSSCVSTRTGMCPR